MKNKKEFKAPSELRFSLISSDWVVVATGRARRPKSFKREKRIKVHTSSKDCFFCNIDSQLPPTLISQKGKTKTFLHSNQEKNAKINIPKNWTLVVIPNKYPAFTKQGGLNIRKEGIHHLMNAYGAAEVVITRSHTKQMAQLSVEEVEEVLTAFQERYLALMKDKYINYISIFQNHGVEAGASIAHPHSQIIATPALDPKITRSLRGAKEYYKHHKECPYCLMNKWDRKNPDRIVYENKEFLAVCPFASTSAFQVSITPKRHLSYFEKITKKQKKYLADAFSVVLKKLYKGLSDPPYNFYLHTAPCDGRNHDYYHWHWVIEPKMATMAGFELCTGIEISTIEPEKAAEYLRNQKI